MCWIWRKDKMVLYAKCFTTGICRVSASDMEETRCSDWNGVMRHYSCEVDCMAKINGNSCPRKLGQFFLLIFEILQNCRLRVILL